MSNITLDLFEYASDVAAQAAYPTDAGLESVVDQQNSSHANAVTLGDNADTEYRLCQSFQLSGAKTLTGIELYMAAKNGSPSGNWTIRIETDNAGKPSGTLANANASVAVTPPGSAGIIKGNFTTPFALSASTTYWIVILCDNQSTGANWNIGDDESGSGYASGNAGYSDDGGSTWKFTGWANIDLYFKVYVQGTVKTLQCYSESSVKHEGTYSMKAVAKITDSVNKTLTRTIGSPIDCSGRVKIKFYVRASRTGANFKISIHDSGGTTTEKTVTIASADTWQQVEWDISAVSDADKNAIDKITITITNADSENTIYFDDMYAAELVAPSVDTDAASSITSCSVVANGEITSIGDFAPTVRGFKYGLTEADTWSVSESGTFSAETFSLLLSALQPNTTYHVRAFATNAAGTTYGDYVEVRTSLVPVDTQIELRDKSGNFKRYITPFVSDVSWEWNRFGGCGHCSITIKKEYREIGFDARDDIQIRIPSGNTTKLVYRGYIEKISPTMQDGQTIVLDVYGYFNLLKKVIVQDSGETKTYTSQEISVIVDAIIDSFVTTNTPIIKGTIDAGSFTVDSLDFFTSVADALDTLATLDGASEYGVDEYLRFFWRTEDETIQNKFLVGDNIQSLSRSVDYSKMVNKIYLLGGKVAGVTYKKTAENTDSQNTYYLSEDTVSNSSITTDTVADQYLGTLLTQNSNPVYNIKASILNTNLRIEDTVPLGAVSFYDVKYDRDSAADAIGDVIGEAADGGSDIIIGLTADGGSNVTIGGSFSAQINRLSYKLSNTPGRFNVTIELGDTISETAAKIKKLEHEMASLQTV